MPSPCAGIAVKHVRQLASSCGQPQAFKICMQGRGAVADFSCADDSASLLPGQSHTQPPSAPSRGRRQGTLPMAGKGARSVTRGARFFMKVLAPQPLPSTTTFDRQVAESAGRQTQQPRQLTTLRCQPEYRTRHFLPQQAFTLVFGSRLPSTVKSYRVARLLVAHTESLASPSCMTALQVYAGVCWSSHPSW